jgi:hypothetical protein
VIGVVVLDVAGDQITSISSVVNLDKLAHLGPVGDLHDQRALAVPEHRLTSFRLCIIEFRKRTMSG